MKARRWQGVAVLATIAALLAGFASGAEAKTEAGSAAADPYKVGIVYSRTGLLAAYGAQYIQGLRYGLAYATKGTMRVNGRPIQLTVADDGTDPTKAVAAGRDLIGKGYKILAGSVSSGCRAPDGAARRAEQGPLHLRPRSRGSRDHRHQPLYLPLRAPDVPGREDLGYVPARRRQEDHGLRAGLGLRRRQLRRRQPGHRPGPHGQPPARSALGAGLHPVRAAGEAGESRPALRCLGRVTTAPAMWRALEQQGVFGVSNKITTGLPSARPGSRSATSPRRSTSSRTTSRRRRRTR